MKNKSIVAGLLSSMLMIGEHNPDKKRRLIQPIESEGDRKRRIDEAKIKINKARGLKEFFYSGNSVWALNKKNADRKARKRHWL